MHYPLAADASAKGNPFLVRCVGNILLKLIRFEICMAMHIAKRIFNTTCEEDYVHYVASPKCFKINQCAYEMARQSAERSGPFFVSVCGDELEI